MREEVSFFGPVLPVWELGVGAGSLWSGTNVSIASRLSVNDYKRSDAQTQRSCLCLQKKQNALSWPQCGPAFMPQTC